MKNQLSINDYKRTPNQRNKKHIAVHSSQLLLPKKSKNNKMQNCQKLKSPAQLIHNLEKKAVHLLLISHNY